MQPALPTFDFCPQLGVRRSRAASALFPIIHVINEDIKQNSFQYWYLKDPLFTDVKQDFASSITYLSHPYIISLLIGRLQKTVRGFAEVMVCHAHCSSFVPSAHNLSKLNKKCLVQHYLALKLKLPRYLLNLHVFRNGFWGFAPWTCQGLL